MIRELIRKPLRAAREKAYQKELTEKKATYDNWYRLHKQELRKEMEAKDHSEGEKYSCEVVRYSHLRSYILSGGEKPDIIIACDDEGVLTDFAKMLILDYFAEHKSINLLYGDEDRLDEDHLLRDPWFKSDWAPDTFLSTFYFGNVFAVRSVALGLINPGSRKASDIEAQSSLKADSEEERQASAGELDDAMRSWIYGRLCLKLAQADGGFSRRVKNKYPIGHIHEVLFHATSAPEPWDSDLIKDSLTGRYSRESANTRLTSIIIPSKDNPKILKQCIKTIEDYTSNSPYEIIVVDNGSSEENQEKIRKLLDEHNENGRAIYVYQPMEFNFSRMCNLGTQYASGELLLFLNDDIEIRKPGWLSYRSEKAKLPYVGAVGMKLLYPHSDIIQHAGVVNVRVGPIHKLQYCSNKEVHYFGYNKGVRNVIAVTGACLMVRADLFAEIGGFDEEKFAVSFNDIDLCYRIYEKGYYNVVRNNMYLYHHESLSRGDDRKDAVKSQRLSREQVALLKSHPDLYGVDPFYHPYLTQNPAITRFEIDDEDLSLRHPNFVTPELLPEKYRNVPEDKVVRIGVECANSISDWFEGPFAKEEHAGYYVRGYSFVIGADNALYERHLLLRQISSGAVYWAPVDNVYRKDIADNLKDQIHDELTGFTCAIPVGALPSGSYLTGMLVIDKTSRQKLQCWTDVKLEIE